MLGPGAAIVLPDRTILLETAHAGFEAAREALAPLAELVKTPDQVHTYRLTPLSLWNFAALGGTGREAVERLRAHARYGVPPEVEDSVRAWADRYGAVVLERTDGGLALRADASVLDVVRADPAVAAYIKDGTRVDAADRGVLKQALARAGWPARDRAGYDPYAPLAVELAAATELRPYQRDAVSSFLGAGDEGGSGVVCLPCGAGKTVVGLAAIAAIRGAALVITSSTQAARQWIREALAKTTLREDQVSEYSHARKRLAPLTVTTYGMLAHRPRGAELPPHLEIFRSTAWGIVVYDEVHLLPAPVFRATAEIQATRRLGLTATLVREDGREEDVFALIGPKRAEVGWKALEAQRWLAEARCVEVRVGLAPWLRDRYAMSGAGEAFRLASTNPRKLEVVETLLERHASDRVLVLGTYLDQLEEIARRARAPVLTGATPEGERGRLFAAFRKGEIRTLVVSRVANFAIDLPDANVAIEVSGSYGSRQEEAQRLGRVLRPKADGRAATFYALVTRETREQPFAARRQRFLLEQGYRYDVVEAERLLQEPRAEAFLS